MPGGVLQDYKGSGTRISWLTVALLTAWLTSPSQGTLQVDASQIVEFPSGTSAGSGPQLALSLGA